MNETGIANSTIPFINAILDRIGKHVSIAMPFFGGASADPGPPPDGKPPKVSQFAAMANMFNGIK